MWRSVYSCQHPLGKTFFLSENDVYFKHNNNNKIKTLSIWTQYSELGNFRYTSLHVVQLMSIYSISNLENNPEEMLLFLCHALFQVLGQCRWKYEDEHQGFYTSFQTQKDCCICRTNSMVVYTYRKSFHINDLMTLRSEIIKFIHKAFLPTACSETLPHIQEKIEDGQKEVSCQPHKHMEPRNWGWGILSHTHTWHLLKWIEIINSDMTIHR